jgi:hypothetical protein
MRRPAICLLLGAALLSLHCGVTQPVRTLPEGTTRITGSFGGPLIPFAGTTIPIPYLTAGIAHGASNDVTVTANAHALMAAMGNIGLDAGAATTVVREERWIPEIVAKGEVLCFSGLDALSTVRVFPHASMTASYDTGPLLAYAGANLLTQFSGDRRWFLTPYGGASIPLNETWTLQAELKWLAANVNTEHGVFEGHAAIGGKGNVGFFLGVSYGL